MADIRLQVNGEDRSADAMRSATRNVEDLGKASVDVSKRSADEIGKSAMKWQEFANFTKAALSEVVKFGVDSVKAFAESERVSRQLQRAAGDLSDVFEKQAEALSKQLAVDDDVIKQQQTLLLQWGAAPSKIEGATRAILDYAAATGKDAQSATMELMRSIDSGSGKLKSLGITYDVTGDKSKDLAAATAAVAKSLHDTAQTDANSLTGSARKAALAFEDLQKAFGGFIADAGQKSGVLTDLTKLMHFLSAEMTGTDNRRTAAVIQAQIDIAQNGLKTYLALSKEERAAHDAWAESHKDIGAQSGYDLRMSLRGLKNELSSQPVLDDKPLNGSGITAAEKAAREAAARQALIDDEARKDNEVKRFEETRKELRDMQEFESDKDDIQKKANAKQQAEDLRMLNEMQATELRAQEQEAKITADYIKHTEEEHKKQHELEKQRLEKEMKEKAAIIRQQQEAWRQAGAELGAAVVQALSAQLAELAKGGEFDVGEFMGDILAAAFSVAATAIGSAYGQPAVGSLVGNLGAMGIKAATRRQKHHDGGWIEAERFHGGGWVGFDETPIIAQPGERMLSRAEVQRMGGGAAVDSMVAGGGGRGGGITINVSGFDAKSTREFFQDRGGQGFRRAVQSGRGDLARMFGNGSLF